MMLKKFSTVFLSLLLAVCAEAQFRVTAHQVGWDNIPPEAVKEGFWFQRSIIAQMDDDPQLEEVMLFGRDNGHWPEFDLFKAYYVIVGTYSKEIKYISPVEYVTDEYNMLVEDMNKDGVSELYITYIKEGSFSVDERGYGKKAAYCHDRIEFRKEEGR